MSLDTKALAYAAQKTELDLRKVMTTVDLLVTQECTIPFISRYRKEATGNLDEVQIRAIKDAYEEYIEMEKRREFILDAIKKQEKLTPELEKKILAADTLNKLEDLYAPYKSKRKTKGTIAKEKGLEPLADFILTSKKSFEESMEELKKQFVDSSEGKVKDLKEALNGACDILIENFAQDPDLKEDLRKDFWTRGSVKSGKRKDAEKITDWDKFKDFFEFDENVEKIKDPRNTHRFLAMRRGMNLKVLKLEVTIDPELAYQKVEAHMFPDSEGLGNYELLQKLGKKAYDNSIASSLDLELKSELKTIADNAAIDVFGVNLKNLLLQPYLGSKAVLGIDPGIRTGCKVVVVDDTGKYVGDHVVYPFAPKFDVSGSKVILEKLIEAFKIKYIAIGNGTNGRETLEFVEDNIEAVKNGEVKASMINESGASIYSASDIARKEFPDKDVTVRGAISIARRFQDPLAELVKIDPKSIGVGQYQHDVNQVRLKKSLGAVVEDCVNFVGVDINTASAPLLSYISGIGPSIAENIVKTREKKGVFKSRKQLLDVSRFSEKIFQQSAGFLRIYGGENPLDGTFIHPEQYSYLEAWAKEQGTEVNALVEDKEIIAKLAQDQQLKDKVGELTFQDIVKSLKAPKQDPRSEFKPVEFRKDVRKIDDLKSGQWYTGVVNNITNFGAFVDLGVKESGLLHVSQIADEYIENPMDKLKVGDKIKVRVLELDLDRKRISLSCKSDGSSDAPAPSAGAPRGNRPKRAPMPPKDIKNNAFAGLKGLKLK
ncbi:MAG: RNA-binding transcriptional accessory protein [Bacteriovoracaceae bacterium]|nr:RNA-binding transcriptional accessory protein [Bacteriovoracaceae bacterium]